jgi:hypothetical protein
MLIVVNNKTAGSAGILARLSAQRELGIVPLSACVTSTEHSPQALRISDASRKMANKGRKVERSRKVLR